MLSWETHVKDEELQTLFTSMQGLINSRPLTPLSSDPNVEPVLTPNHFLIGYMEGKLLPESVDTTSFNLRKTGVSDQRKCTKDVMEDGMHCSNLPWK